MDRVMLLAIANLVIWAEAYWGASVGVEHDLGGLLAAQGDRHLQRLFDQIGAHVFGDGPAEYPAGVGVDDGGQVEPALPGAQVGGGTSRLRGYVADPDAVQRPGVPDPGHRISGVGISVIDDRGGGPPLGTDAAQPEVAHRLGDGLGRDDLPVLTQVDQDPRCPDTSSDSPWNQAILASIRSVRSARADGPRPSQA